MEDLKGVQVSNLFYGISYATLWRIISRVIYFNNNKIHLFYAITSMKINCALSSTIYLIYIIYFNINFDCVIGV